MDISGLNKIADAIGNAFSVFDFSFFISGFVTFTIIVFDVIVHNGASWIKGYIALPSWIFVITSLIMIYVCGLISWMMGRTIREGVVVENGETGTDDCSAQCDFEKVYDDIIQCIDTEHLDKLSLPNKHYIYSYMWIKLESLPDNVNVKCHLAYCRRLWVMRALFEGLLFSWLLAIIVLFDIVFFENDFLYIDIKYVLILFFIFVILAFFSGRTAKSYAQNQLKDTIIAYKIFCLKQ